MIPCHKKISGVGEEAAAAILLLKKNLFDVNVRSLDSSSWQHQFFVFQNPMPNNSFEKLLIKAVHFFTFFIFQMGNFYSSKQKGRQVMKHTSERMATSAKV